LFNFEFKQWRTQKRSNSKKKNNNKTKKLNGETETNFIGEKLNSTIPSESVQEEEQFHLFVLVHGHKGSKIDFEEIEKSITNNLKDINPIIVTLIIFKKS
jgi:hypothetical protein